MQPLQQWICDTCKTLIPSPKAGWLEWLVHKERVISNFRIVHHQMYSPYRTSHKDACYQLEAVARKNDAIVADGHLDTFIGPNGLARIISLFDWEDLDRVRSKPELAELMRRLFVPNYEEARQYWEAATDDGYFAGMNEYAPYTQQYLLEVIQKYGPQPREKSYGASAGSFYRFPPRDEP